MILKKNRYHEEVKVALVWPMDKIKSDAFEKIFRGFHIIAWKIPLINFFQRLFQIFENLIAQVTFSLAKKSFSQEILAIALMDLSKAFCHTQITGFQS